MPGPTTEVLNDDLKELRSDLHRVETALSTAVAKLAAEFGLFKWLVSAALVASVSGVISSAYWAGSLASRVTAIEGRADKADGRLDRIESSLSGITSRLERIEASITKAIGRTGGTGAVTSEKR